jgi:hypothetical protein
VPAVASQTAEDALVEAAGAFYADPYGFVRFAYPWGEPGPLKDHPGPDDWQREFLTDLGNEVKAHVGKKAPFMPIRRAIASGHGIGKSTLVAWLVNWLMVTRPETHGTVTANTFDQLETKTWASIQKWTKLCIFSHWFECNTGKLYAKGRKEDWFCHPASSKEENSEAFAGQHSEQGSSVYFFDEDSAIPDKIHEVAEGGLTDGEPMIFLFGNPTRNSGHFHQACFGSGRDLWHPRSIDSRSSRFTNKALIQEWIDTYGEDSDFVRVRVRGLPPRASELQFIDQERVWQAQKRVSPVVFPDEPLIAGVDVSDGGSAWNVVRFRKGADARSIPPIRVPGEAVRNDRSAFLARLSEVLTSEYEGRKVDMMFIDSAFGAPYVERLHTMGYKNVVEVRFGADSLDFHQANLRAYMWARMKEWFSSGAIDPRDTKLETDLTGPGYHINKQDKLVIESKEDMAKRGFASPDDGDALALTFAAPVGPGVKPKKRAQIPVDRFVWG